MIDVPDQVNPSIVMQPAARADHVSWTTLIGVLIAAALASCWASRAPLAPLPAFIPAFAGTTGTADALTAALLLSLYRTDGARELRAAAAAYLVNALLIVPYALTFPGVIDAHGFIGNEQSAVCLWLIWHVTFPLILIAGIASSRLPARARTRWADGLSVFAPCAAFAVAATVLVTVARDDLPVLVRAGVFSTAFSLLALAASLLNLAAGAVFLRVVRPLPVLYLWLVAALIASALDTALNAIAPARYSVPWYVGKALTYGSASVVLFAIIAAWAALQNRSTMLAARLATTLADRRALQAKLVREREIAVVQQRAAEAELLFNRVVEAAPNAMLLVDERGDITFVNVHAEKLFGYSRAELVGHPIELLVPEFPSDGKPDFRDWLAEAARCAESGLACERPGRRRNGSEVPLEIRLSAVAAPKAHVLVVMTDITERAGAELRLKLLIEASPSAMLLLNSCGEITLINAQTEILFGYARSELVGVSIDRLVPDRFAAGHPQLRAMFHAAPVARAMGAGRDLYGRRKDGSEVPVEIRLSPINSPAGIFTLAAVTDITERKAAEELRFLQADAQRRAAELEAARERTWSTTFQRAVLPATLPHVTGCAFDAVYDPGLAETHVGGDWYDALQLIDGRVLVAIGDVAGTGLNAAVVVGVARQVMRGIAQLHANPSLILDAADRALCLEYPGVYVSTWVGLIDLVTRTITYASAGHPPPLLVAPDATIRELSDPTTMLIGLREGQRGQPNTVALGAHDILVLYTDGVIEAGRDIIAGLRSLHAAAAMLPALAGASPAAGLLGTLVPHGSFDDAAILVVRTDCVEAESQMRRWCFDAGDAQAASAVRSEFVAALERRNFSPDDCSSAELVFGELIGNVVRHAGRARQVDAVVDTGGQHTVLHVMDRGTGFSHVGRLPRDPYAEDGRGLFLIGVLTIDFTVAERPDGGSHARAVLRGGAPVARSAPSERFMPAIGGS